ncbi:MAG: pilus assembly protein TadG-related protein [Pseudomonas sp.]
MSLRLRSGRQGGPARQRGAIGLMAALTLGMALLFLLLVIDSSRLYVEKRKLQSVADTAALEAANRGGQCASSTTANDYATQNATRNGFTIVANTRAVVVTCGTLVTNASNQRVFSANASQNDAIQVVASETVATSVAGGIWNMVNGTAVAAQTTVSAVAVAALGPPLASLTIRSTALVVDTNNAPLLNALTGGLLGGAVNISVAGWNGLINTNISLLSYLNQLKLDLGLTAGGYTQVLGNTIAVGQLIQSAINVLDPTHTLSATATIASLQALKVAAGATTVVLGNVLSVESGASVAALAVNMRVFDLIQGFVQLANKQNGLVASFPINLPGVAQITASVQVLQPPQLSAIGNPALATAPGQNPMTGPNRIYVQTAQLRTKLSVNLPILNTVSKLTNAVNGLASPLLGTLDALLSLNLVGVINSLTCAVSCTSPVLQVLPPPVGIDIELDAASAASWVTGYSCASPTSKTLTTATNTSLVNLRMGQIASSSVFGTGPTPPTVVVTPLKIVDIGTKTCTLIVFCNPVVTGVGGGLGLSANIQVGGAYNIPYTYQSPNLPEISQPPYYSSYSTTNIVSGLTDPVNGVTAGLNLNMYGPTPGNANVLGNLIGGLGSVLSGVTTLLLNVLNATLIPLINSLVNTLLLGLGVDLNQVGVGANLSCHSGNAYLVI